MRAAPNTWQARKGEAGGEGARARIFRRRRCSEVSALGCDEGSCRRGWRRLDATKTEASVDASEDITDDFAFSDSSGPVWCDAGPPVFLAACGACCIVVDVVCPISQQYYWSDASSALFNCDWYCGSGYEQGACYVLPDASDGEGGTYVKCQCMGRRFAGYRARRGAPTLGGYFASMARLESASVVAFHRLFGELCALGAPERLLARVRRSIEDEQRHTRTARRLAGQKYGSGVVLSRARRFRDRTVERIATWRTPRKVVSARCTARWLRRAARRPTHRTHRSAACGGPSRGMRRAMPPWRSTSQCSSTRSSITVRGRAWPRQDAVRSPSFAARSSTTCLTVMSQRRWVFLVVRRRRFWLRR